MTAPHRHLVAPAALAALAGCLLTAACGPAASVPPSSAPARPPASATASTGAAPTAAASAVATVAAAPGGSKDACALVTQQEVAAVLGTDPGQGAKFSSHGATQCQYGTFQSAFVLVNLTPSQGPAAYDLMHGNAKAGHMVDVPGLGDRAFEITGPGTASIYVGKGDVLVLVMVEIHAAAAPPTGQVRALADKAAARV